MKEQKSDYEQYLEKYCQSRGIPREEAEKHLIVIAYRHVCEERERKNTDNKVADN